MVHCLAPAVWHHGIQLLVYSKYIQKLTVGFSWKPTQIVASSCFHFWPLYIPFSESPSTYLTQPPFVKHTDLQIATQISSYPWTVAIDCTSGHTLLRSEWSHEDCSLPPPPPPQIHTYCSGFLSVSGSKSRCWLLWFRAWLPQRPPVITHSDNSWH